MNKHFIRSYYRSHRLEVAQIQEQQFLQEEVLLDSFHYFAFM